MKLLIVDDEILTRNGIQSSLNWEELGISKIIEADNGIHALKIAKLEKPALILSDIRMPQMSGIEFAKKISAFLPDSKIIFMSGYSDKEYLKAAIKLKVVTYIEKPLSPAEIKQAILEAKESYLMNQNLKETVSRYHTEADSKLAALLTKPYVNVKPSIDQLLKAHTYSINKNSRFSCFLIQGKTSSIPAHHIELLKDDLATLLTPSKVISFHTTLHDKYHVFFLLHDGILEEKFIYSISKLLKEYPKHLTSTIVSIGFTKKAGIEFAYEAYSNSVLLMQQGFFFPSGTLITDKLIPTPSLVSQSQLEHILLAYKQSVLLKQIDDCNKYLGELFSYYQFNTSIVASHAKDTYYKLFLFINETHVKWKLHNSDSLNTHTHSILELIESCTVYEELHSLLSSRTNSLFVTLENESSEDSSIYLIKEYIAQNFSNDLLSIKEISDYVNLSVSYLCSYFKAQTGHTLNQYITEYRLEYAKELLADHRIQINDISTRVGYSNSNYFAKSFKKYSGFTPSSYREHIEKW